MKSLELKKKRALNLACGSDYIDSDEWLNVDWNTSDPKVLSLNLLNIFPFPSNTFDLVYTSHFVEHIKRNDMLNFISECYRILAPGGIMRIVTPDWDNMVSEYLAQIKSGHLDLSDWLKVEILDQCVRKTPGGEMKHWLSIANSESEIAAFIQLRTGWSRHLKLDTKDSLPFKRTIASLLFQMRRTNLATFKKRITRVYIYLIVGLLPKWFRDYQVSMTDPGENHQWIYSERELKIVLESVGFRDFVVRKFNTTGSTVERCLELDMTENSKPRKGQQSLYVEATKV